MTETQFNNMLLGKNIDKYLKATKEEKGKLLDDMERLSGMHRKSIIRAIKIKQLRGVRIRGGSKKKYAPETIELLEMVWETGDYVCAERLESQVYDLIDTLDKLGYLKDYNKKAIKQVRQMPLGTMKVKLKELEKPKFYQERNTSQGEIKKIVPVRTNFKKVTKVGYFGVDFVNHNGGSESGKFARTMCTTEIRSGWISRSATRGKDRSAVEKAADICIEKIPTHIYELHSDNETNLIHTLLRDYGERRKIAVTRTRSYQSQDNGHVEQKNGDKIRNLIGYFRIDTEDGIEILNQIYEIDDVYQNHFVASQRLERKVYNNMGKLVRKIYDKAKTPYRRLIEDKTVNVKIKMKLISEHQKLDPRKLREKRTKLLKRLWNVR
jgi:hypothetical protein